MAYVCQEFPKMKYHPERGTTIVNNADEEKTLGRGWYNNPNEFPKPSKIVTTLENKVKPWWTRWQWLVTGIGIVLATIASAIKLLQ
jgi:hypothetical protein